MTTTPQITLPEPVVREMVDALNDARAFFRDGLSGKSRQLAERLTVILAQLDNYQQRPRPPVET